MKTRVQIFSQLLEISEKSFYRWRSKDHIKLLSLLEKYFNEDDIEEFLETGKIVKLELVKLEFETFNILEKSFFNRIKYLYNESESEYFYNFIIYYISHSYCYRWIEENDIDVWEGLNDIEEFKELYYLYLLQSDIKAVTLKRISIFINKFDENNLAYLNISIADGFSQLLKTNEDYYCTKLKTSLKKEFIWGLENSLKKSLNYISSDKTKSFININSMILKLIEKKAKEFK